MEKHLNEYVRFEIGEKVITHWRYNQDLNKVYLVVDIEERELSCTCDKASDTHFIKKAGTRVPI